MKLELIADAGDEPVALFAQVISARHSAIVGNLANRLFGAGVSFDAELSYRWNCTVHCTPEFSTWWRAREGEPDDAQRIFLEVHAHA